MYTIDETEDILNEIAEAIPADFYQQLNGGIVLKEEAKLHPQNRGNDLYVMGEYISHPHLGKYIAIYYGSFIRIHGNAAPERYREELGKVLKHEFRHHLEGLAGRADLEVEDRSEIEAYLKNWRD